MKNTRHTQRVTFRNWMQWVLRVLRGLMVCSGIGILWGWSGLWFPFIITFVLNGSLMLWGMFIPNSQVFGHVLSQGRRDKKVVALTFDDGPSQPHTSQILDILEHFGVPATFFVVGRKAVQHADLIQRMVRQKHEVANHTWSHNPLLSVYPFFSFKKVHADIRKCSTVIQNITEFSPRYVRFPAGIKNIPMMKAAHQLNLTVTGFSVRAFESSQRLHKEIIVHRIQKKIHSGAIILLHDGGRETIRVNHSSTVEALPIIIEWLLSNHYKCVLLPDLES